MPNPKRFENFILNEEEDGFKLEDGSEFWFDKNNGWFDEFFNYYDSTGEVKKMPLEV